MNTPKGVTLHDVKLALRELGGEADWFDILNKLTENRGGDHSYYLDRHNYEESARQVIQQHCPSYKKYTGRSHFEKVRSRPVRYRLIEITTLITPITPHASDIKEPEQPERIKLETYRILRDTKLAREVKEINDYKCQICNFSFTIGGNKPYSEAHHIKPLGGMHSGPDVRENIICVCPNHHAMLDYGAIELDASLLDGVGEEYINYHNEIIYGKMQISI